MTLTDPVRTGTRIATPAGIDRGRPAPPRPVGGGRPPSGRPASPRPTAAGRSSTRSTSRCPPASSPASSARTAPGRPRRSGCSSGLVRPTSGTGQRARRAARPPGPLPRLGRRHDRGPRVHPGAQRAGQPRWSSPGPAACRPPGCHEVLDRVGLGGARRRRVPLVQPRDEAAARHRGGAAAAAAAARPRRADERPRPGRHRADARAARELPRRGDDGASCRATCSPRSSRSPTTW